MARPKFIVQFLCLFKLSHPVEAHEEIYSILGNISFRVRNGYTVCFLKDRWFEKVPLACFQYLYALANH